MVVASACDAFGFLVSRATPLPENSYLLILFPINRGSYRKRRLEISYFRLKGVPIEKEDWKYPIFV